LVLASSYPTLPRIEPHGDQVRGVEPEIDVLCGYGRARTSGDDEQRQRSGNLTDDEHAAQPRWRWAPSD
jgi:hypothetical protein